MEIILVYQSVLVKVLNVSMNALVILIAIKVVLAKLNQVIGKKSIFRPYLNTKLSKLGCQTTNLEDYRICKEEARNDMLKCFRVFWAFVLPLPLNLRTALNSITDAIQTAQPLMMTILNIVLVWSPALVCSVNRLIEITCFLDGCPCPGYDCTINQTTAPYTRQPEISRPSDTCTVSESGSSIIWDLSESNYVDNMQCDLNIICQQSHQVVYQLTRLDIDRDDKLSGQKVGRTCCPSLDIEQGYDYIRVYFKGIEYETTNEEMVIDMNTPTHTWFHSSALQDMADIIWTTDNSNSQCQGLCDGWTMEIACADPTNRKKLSKPTYNL